MILSQSLFVFPSHASWQMLGQHTVPAEPSVHIKLYFDLSLGPAVCLKLYHHTVTLPGQLTCYTILYRSICL